MIDSQTALIYTMVLASAADSEMTDSELGRIGDIVSHLPVFAGFDTERMVGIAEDCAELLIREDGLDEAFDQIRAALPADLRETAYTLACDIVAADNKATQEELRLLELFRHAMDIDRLTAAAIERAARARYMTL